MSTFTSINDVVDAIADAAVPGRRLVVGIAGSPGAGKSTIAEQVVARLGAKAALLPLDGFHLPKPRLIELGRLESMGAEDTFDKIEFLSVLTAVHAFAKTGRDVVAPSFDRSTEEPVAGGITIAPEVSIVVVEGNYLLLDWGAWEHAATLLDVTIFVDVDHNIRRERLIARHERYGKSAEAARAWVLGTDERNAGIIEPTAARADHLIRL